MSLKRLICLNLIILGGKAKCLSNGWGFCDTFHSWIRAAGTHVLCGVFCTLIDFRRELRCL